MESVLSDRVLVLNKSWVPINVSTVKRALTMVLHGVAKVVKTDDYSVHDFESWVEASRAAKEGRLIKTTRFAFKAPEVIVVNKFNRILFGEEVKFSRRNIFERDRDTCQYCGKRLKRKDLTLDHVKPRSRGGKSTWDNVVLACLPCNARKDNRLPSEARMRLLNIPSKPKWATKIGCMLVGHRLKSWERFLDEAYWDIELKE